MSCIVDMSLSAFKAPRAVQLSVQLSAVLGALRVQLSVQF
jgi:hypothetical protein